MDHVNETSRTGDDGVEFGRDDAGTYPDQSVTGRAPTIRAERDIDGRRSPGGHPLPAASADARRWQAGIQSYYDRLVDRTKNPRVRYYRKRLIRRLSLVVEPGKRVLEIGCASGELLAALKPAVGVGVDVSPEAIRTARKRFPGYRFVAMCGEDVARIGDTFDYVVISQTLGEVYDLGALFRAIQSVCHARTRVVVAHYSRLWQPALRVMEWMRLRARKPEQNWLPPDQINHLLLLAGFETISHFGTTIVPLKVPLVSEFLNRFVGNLPFVHHLGLSTILIARPVHAELLESARPRSVSIVIPARNEAGHIKSLLERIPVLAEKQEIIFVEGNSTDDTWPVIQRVAAEYQGPFSIRCLRQEGKGKGDAVRKGFAAAMGDVLMILDADISVPPEELPRFIDALASGKGEMINGSRMVYLMDNRAMRFLNILGNKVFGCVFTYLLSQWFRDTLCGTKVLTRSDYQRIEANRAFFGDFDPFGDFDLLFGAAKLNLKIVDVPVHYKARTYGETNISRFTHGWMLLRMCLLAARKLKFA